VKDEETKKEENMLTLIFNCLQQLAQAVFERAAVPEVLGREVQTEKTVQTEKSRSRLLELSQLN
jgi:hypothetical protein